MGRREDEAALREAIAVVEAACAVGAARFVALPRTLSYDVARRLEVELRARGLVGARYRDEPRSWDLWDRLETVLGLDEDEPRVEWGEVKGRKDAGCWIRFDDAAEPGDPESAGLIDAGYNGPLPRSAKDETVHAGAWDQRKAVHPGTVPHRATLWLDFADGALNLGDIATGRVKNFIDCLYPIVGGAAGSPDDHRFERIVVTRSSKRAANAAVRVRIEPRGFVDATMGPRPGGPDPARKVAGVAAAADGDSSIQTGSRPDSNPCTQIGSCKWLVAQASIEGWSPERLRSELEATGIGRGARIGEYLSDLSQENRLRLIWRDGKLVLAN